MNITLRSGAELEKMHRAGMIVWGALEELKRCVAPGLTTKELDAVAERYAVERSARPAFKNYRGFPASLCVSINSEVVHGIPSPKRNLREGDILSMDFGVELDGYFADAAVTVPVGAIEPERARLLAVTRDALQAGIDNMRPGNRLGDVSSAVQRVVEENGLSIVRDFCGHSIGTRMHEDLQVPNYGSAGRGPRLEPGLVLALEPMVNRGGPGVRVLGDQWTAVTLDGSDSAHFEHTVAVTKNGSRILTRPPDAAGLCW